MRQVIAFLFFLICVKAQNTKQKHEEDEEMSPLHPSMAVVLVVLSIMFCLTFLILAYAKFCHTVSSRPSSDPLHHPNEAVGTRSRFSGVDKTIIESLPFFRFSSLKGSKEGLECAICLSRFEESGLLRLLPKCRHAFHMSCIDTWLENHSSCPICRYKFEASDIKSSRYSVSSSFRFPGSSREEPGLEFFIQREQNQGRSSRFNLANTLQRLARGRRDEPLIEEFKNRKEILHNVKHRIIVSDVLHKSRWSDVNSSDMMSLSSEMLNAMARKGMASSGRFNEEVEGKEQILKIKEDMERKRLVESKILARTEPSNTGESSGRIEMDSSIMSRPSDPAQKRSMSEITNFSRFTEMNSSSSNSSSRRYSTSLSSEKDDRVRKLWLPIARRTIQLFSGQETSSDARKNTTNV